MKNLIETIKEDEMKTTSEYLCQRAMLLGMEINKKGLAHAFVSYSGHVNALSVQVRPLCHVYKSDAETPPAIYNESAYTNGELFKEGKLQTIVARLEDIARGVL